MKNPQKQSQPPLECFKGRGTACGGGDKDKTEYNYAEKTAMTYVYDSNGNIVSKTPYTNVTSSDLSAATQGTAIVYGYGDSNWSDKLTSYDGQTISYDESGNPTSYKGDTVTWNGRLMTSYTKGERRYEFAYNSDGMRTAKRAYENGELVYTYTYIWDGDVLLGGRMEDDEGVKTTVRYLYDDSGELYGMDYNGTVYAGFVKNLQGDIVSIVPLDSENDSKVNIEYDAWGKPIIGQTSSAQEKLLLIMMIAVTNVAYRSYFYDFDTGLYYLRSRYYDPETGRFINADDTAYLGYDASPLSMNLFAYCENNPVNWIDKDGKKSAQIRDNNAIMITSILMSAIIISDYLVNFSIIPHKKYKDKYIISIDFVKNGFYKLLFDFYQMIKDKIFEALALIACTYFENEKKRPFLFSDECVENEIKEHYLGYMYFTGYSIKPPTVITGYYISHGIIYVNNPYLFAKFRQSIVERCKEADISEADAILYPKEAMGFNYFDGIRSCYKNTIYDPYYINGKRKRSYKNTNWLNIKLRCP